MEQRPDILLFMSDQHAAWYMGHESGLVDTPSLDALAAEGTQFANHYTACPLCVPARMSMLSGQLPTHVGVTANNHTLAEVTPTFLFPLVEKGYETVLIGRMHFMGKDLRHGFTKRIGGDMTPTSWIPAREEILRERGKLMPTFSTGGCLNVIGGGKSPVRSYDEEIVGQALEYLSQPHEKPQFIVVGTFGPHFPYVAKPELYQKYLRRKMLPENFDFIPDYVEQNPWLKSHCREVDEETAQKALAAYCALIEEMDGHIGVVRSAFEKAAEQRKRKAIFAYVSDHGDTVGAYHMYGKQTFFDDSARVPFILAGDQIPAGQVIKQNTSLMDVGPTMCAMAGTQYSEDFVDGKDLVPLISGNGTVADDKRLVISEYLENRGGVNLWEAQKQGYAPKPEQYCYAAMARWGRWKYMTYHGCEEQAVLFDMEAKPRERENVAARFPEVAAYLKERLLEAVDPNSAEKQHRNRNRMHQWLRTCERETGAVWDERWKNNPEDARGQLDIS